jgi:hypothetical protein
MGKSDSTHVVSRESIKLNAETQNKLDIIRRDDETRISTIKRLVDERLTGDRTAEDIEGATPLVWVSQSTQVILGELQQLNETYDSLIVRITRERGMYRALAMEMKAAGMRQCTKQRLMLFDFNDLLICIGKINKELSEGDAVLGEDVDIMVELLLEEEDEDVKDSE